jgi:predicted Zn-dependent protease
MQSGHFAQDRQRFSENQPFFRPDPPKRFADRVHAFPGVIKLPEIEEAPINFEDWKELRRTLRFPSVSTQFQAKDSRYSYLRLPKVSESYRLKISVLPSPSFHAIVLQKLEAKGIKLGKSFSTPFLIDITDCMRSYFHGAEVFLSPIQWEFYDVQFIKDTIMRFYVRRTNGSIIIDEDTGKPEIVQFDKMWDKYLEKFMWQASGLDLANVGNLVQNEHSKNLITALLTDFQIQEDILEDSVYGVAYPTIKIAIISLEAHRPFDAEFDAKNMWPNCYRKAIIEENVLPVCELKDLNPTIIYTLGLFEHTELINLSPITTAISQFASMKPLNNHSSQAEIDGFVLWRVCKTISHELLHLMGVEHCAEPQLNCVMIDGSAGIFEATDEHSANVCPHCLQKLIYATRYELSTESLDSQRLEIERYIELYYFCLSKSSLHGFAPLGQWIYTLLLNFYDPNLVTDVLKGRNGL